MDDIDVLVVDDSAADAELTNLALTRSCPGHRVAVVSDGDEAMDFLLCRGAFSARPVRPPRLVLLDLKLSRLDGLEVLHLIKADAQLRAIPVVVLSCSNEERDLVRAYQSGANSFLQKPVDFESFREMVRAAGRYWLGLNQNAPPGAFREDGDAQAAAHQRDRGLEPVAPADRR